jgi:hypothetical protein
VSLERLWQILQRDGYAAIDHAHAEAALDHFYLALIAFSHQDVTNALQHAQRAAELEPDRRVFVESARYLARVQQAGKHRVYDSGEAFGAFIRGGSNVKLYKATSAALRQVYQEFDTLGVLDIGAGDGLALLPALTDTVRQLDVLEPSRAMLESLSRALDVRGIPHRAINATLQDFVKRPDAARKWDVIQATYSLQSIPFDERPALFEWLRDHCPRLLIVEFDAPDFTHALAPERVRHVVERFERGLAEYRGDGGWVAQGFLLPVMFGYFDSTAARTNYEQPLQKWGAELRAAGFERIDTRPLYPYWWAEAYLIDARAA